MNEKNKEFVAVKKWDTWQKALFAGVILAMLVAFVLLSTIWWMVAFLFVLVILSLYYMKNTFKAEYAYTVSGKIVVEVLKSGGKREPVCEFFASTVKMCGKYNSENKGKLEGISNIVKAATDIKDEDDTYFALVEKDNEKMVVLFTPNDMMLDELKKVLECKID